MLNKFMAAAAVSALALTSAMAQTSTTPSASPSATTPPAASAPATTPPAASAPATSPSPSASTTAPKSGAAQSASTTAPKSDAAHFVTKQTSDQWLFSKFKGTDVVGTDDKKIGDVSDVLFDKDKKILAYIVGVGGFLGIGAKDVAIDPASFQAVPGKDATDFKLRLSMTKDELKAAPTFEPYSAPRPVSSSNQPATRPMGAPSPMTPPTSKQ